MVELVSPHPLIVLNWTFSNVIGELHASLAEAVANQLSSLS